MLLAVALPTSHTYIFPIDKSVALFWIRIRQARVPNQLCRWHSAIIYTYNYNRAARDAVQAFFVNVYINYEPINCCSMRKWEQLLFLFFCFSTASLTLACELDQMRHGCRIHNAQCSCGYGCKSEYRYDNTEDCKLALEGQWSFFSSRYIFSKRYRNYYDQWNLFWIF